MTPGAPNGWGSTTLALMIHPAYYFDREDVAIVKSFLGFECHPSPHPQPSVEAKGMAKPGWL